MHDASPSKGFVIGTHSPKFYSESETTMTKPIFCHTESRWLPFGTPHSFTLTVAMSPGDIPADLGKLHHLQSLILEGNKLVGELP